ncbi:MAG: hypothetical protein H0V32_07640 [Nocardioidaceae bacterium]|nr:hypothetical protein [Nocardioidaceae bacterium]
MLRCEGLVAGHLPAHHRFAVGDELDVRRHAVSLLLVPHVDGDQRDVVIVYVREVVGQAA